MPRVEFEVTLARQPSLHGIQQVAGEIEHSVANETAGMQVAFACDGVRQVVGRRTVTHVHMSNHAQLSQRLQGPINRRTVNIRVSLLEGCV